MKSIRDRGRVAVIALLALCLAALFAGCNIFGPDAVYDTADVTISVGASAGPSGAVVVGPARAAIGGAATDATAPVPGAPSFAIGSSTSPDDIDTVVLTVAGEDRFGVYQDPLATLTLSGSGASWSGTVAGLPLGPALTFTVEALDAAGTLIYSGTTTSALSALKLTVALVLLPYDDAATVVGFPVIRQITRPAEIIEGTDASVSVDLEGSSSETLTVELTSGGGSFAPASPIGVPLSGGAAALDLTYSAPSDAPDTYLHTIRTENEQGNSVSREFTTTVVWETADIGISIGGVAPAVTGFSLSLTPTGDLVIEATVTDDGPLSEISFDWTYDGGLVFSDPAVNPATLTGYGETATGTVSLTVTDSDTSIVTGGLSTTVTFLLPAGLFPDDVVSQPPVGSPSGWFDYEVVGGVAEITGLSAEWSGSSDPGKNELVFPSVLDGYPVTRIRNSAIQNKTTLTSVTIPGSIEVIDDGAFYGSSNLTNLVFEEGVREIRAWSFFISTSLPSVFIPASVELIEPYAFVACSSLTDITVDPANAYYRDIDGVLYNKSATALIQYGAGRPANGFAVPAGVTEIGDAALYRVQASSITLPDGLVAIGSQSIASNYSLASIAIPDTVQTIGYKAFESCNLATVSIPASVTSIGNYAFVSNSSLATVNVYPGTPPALGTHVFDYASSSLSIRVPAASVSAYQAAVNWSDYAAIITGM